MRTRVFIFVLAAACLMGASPAVAEQPATPSPLATVTIGPAGVTVRSQSQVPVSVAFGGPDGLATSGTLKPGARVVFGLSGEDGTARPDGTYRFEVRGTTETAPAPIARAEDGRVAAGWQTGPGPATPPAVPVVQSGAFSILNGAFVLPQEEGPSGAATPLGAVPGPLDAVTLDDAIIVGSLCVGFDCVNGEEFGFDTVRLKENNTRIRFFDTSTSAGFPNNQWQLTANDSASGGANKFSIDDITSARTPFTVEAGAPTNSLFVRSNGRIGFGTSVPVLAAHALAGDTPGVRFEQDGGGWAPQTWDVAGNEANFFVRDVTGGSLLPFRIKPGAPTNSLFVDAAGNVGLGTQTPAARLDVQGDVTITGSLSAPTLDAHLADTENPHQTTAAQVGADAAGAAATAVAAHEAAFDHSAFVHIKSGVVPGSSFKGTPRRAKVTFAQPYPEGTQYVVSLTVETAAAEKLHNPNVFKVTESGFVITLGNFAVPGKIVAVHWTARPAGEF